MSAVEVCPICDIAGCRHIRERAELKRRYGDALSHSNSMSDKISRSAVLRLVRDLRHGKKLRRSKQSVADRMAAKVAELPSAEVKDDAYGYACRLAVSIKRSHYPVPEEFILFDDTLGVLTQIDNMVAGLRRDADADQATMFNRDQLSDIRATDREAMAKLAHAWALERFGRQAADDIAARIRGQG